MNQRTKDIDVIGVGSPMIDFFINGQLSSTHKSDSRFPSEDSKGNWLKLVSNETIISTGGSVVNTMMGLAALDVRTALIGKLGNDEFSDLFLRLISDFSIDTTELKTSSQSNSTTGICFIHLSESGANSMSTFLGSSLEFSLSSTMMERIKSARVVYLEGYLWNSEAGRALCLEIGELCHKYKTMLAFNLSDKHTVLKHAPALHDYIDKFVRILFGNFDEFVACYGESRLHNKLNELSAAPRIICMTHDKKGSIVFSEGDHFKSPAKPIRCLNSTGAGDLFVSGFLASYLNNESLEKAAERGASVAAHIISVCPSEKVSSIRALNTTNIEYDKQGVG